MKKLLLTGLLLIVAVAMASADLDRVRTVGSGVEKLLVVLIWNVAQTSATRAPPEIAATVVAIDLADPRVLGTVSAARIEFDHVGFVLICPIRDP